MLQLISKLQHNTYEKGEFSDEQPRNLDETIQVIKDFPWDAERALTDIQLTGPSVTIQDDDLNYLKLGLYFNGKFCVYYLDRDNHLYEYHAPTIDEACNLVNDFFSQTLDLKQFEKHFFNIGNQPHFVTNDFVYRVNPIRIFAIALLATAYLLFLLLNLLRAAMGHAGPSTIEVLLLVVVVGVLVGYVATITIKGRHQYLQISQGKTEFSYGYDEQHIVAYNKSNIREISYTIGGKGSIHNVKIFFKNGEVIKPVNVINGIDLLQKFSKTSGITLTVNRSSFGNR